MARETKQIAILGLGIFGSTLAETLTDFGCEVLAVDNDPVCVERIADNVTRAVVADVTDKEQLLELGVQDFDVCVVAISKHFEESVLTTMILKEFGVEQVIAKARTKRKKMILEKVGADRVILTEKEMAMKLAKKLLRRSIVDLVEIDDEYSMVEIKAMESWVGKSLKLLNVRSTYGMNIIGVKWKGEEKLNLDINADYQIKSGDHFLVVSKTIDIEKFDHLTKD